MRKTMKRVVPVLIVASFGLGACGDSDGGGGSGARDELAALLIADAPPGVETSCLEDKIDELSDEDAQFLIDNVDNASAEFDADLEAWLFGVMECVESNRVIDE